MLGSRNPFDMPKKLPVFPLTGAVLMPFGHLPLNIFEPRYIQMIDDALGAGRIVGMIQPRGTQSEPVPDDAALYDIGTAGRIIQFQDSGDGRYLITLEGLARFRVASLYPAGDNLRGYRCVEAEYECFQHDLTPTERDDGPGRGRILELMQDYFGDKDIDADWNAVSEAPYEALVASLAMSCPFAPEEKQALLECGTHEDRAHMLISLFEMSGMTTQDHGVFKH